MHRSLSRRHHGQVEALAVAFIVAEARRKHSTVKIAEWRERIAA